MKLEGTIKIQAGARTCKRCHMLIQGYDHYPADLNSTNRNDIVRETFWCLLFQEPRGKLRKRLEAHGDKVLRCDECMSTFMQEGAS